MYEPNSPYSASKAASDHLVRAWHHTYGLPVLTTNCSNNYGPFHFPEKLIPLMIVNALAEQAAADLRRRHAGARLALRDRTTAPRSARCWRAARSARPTTSAAGTRSRTSTSCDACAPCSTRCSRRAAGSYARLKTHVTDRPGHDRRYAIDASKIERELGWRPAETFESGLRKTVRWYLDNARWVERVQTGAYRQWLSANYDAAAGRAGAMKILLFGKNGQVGWELQRSLAPCSAR